MILKNISQGDVKHIITLPIKTKTSVVNVSTYIITGITVRHIRLAVILAIMFISTFKAPIILNVCTTSSLSALFNRVMYNRIIDCFIELYQASRISAT
jgi:hypothetical protein